MNVIDFGYMVLKKEGLGDWKIKRVGGDEGYCHRSTKTINFGKGTDSFKLMLHEIAHCLTNAYHYTDEFEEVVNRLEQKYLRESNG